MSSSWRCVRSVVYTTRVQEVELSLLFRKELIRGALLEAIKRANAVWRTEECSIWEAEEGSVKSVPVGVRRYIYNAQVSSEVHTSTLVWLIALVWTDERSQATKDIGGSKSTNSSLDRSVVCDVRGEQMLGLTSEEKMPVAQQVRYSPEMYAALMEKKQLGVVTPKV